jgi:hypothetical protein
VSSHLQRTVFIATVLGIAACALHAQDTLKRAICLSNTALYGEPDNALLPQSFLEKGDSCIVDTFFTDSSGVSWFKVRATGGIRWARELSVSYISGQNTDVRSDVLNDQADAKRRMKILMTRQEWPRRIRSAVREGKICLGMDEPQLIAAWGDPVQKGKSFILGIGQCDAWFYQSRKGTLLFVVLANGTVAGWYNRE